jgi:hypothetical protein
MAFSQVAQAMTATQKANMAALRKTIMSGTYNGQAFDFSVCTTPFLYSAAITDTSLLDPYISNTDYLFDFGSTSPIAITTTPHCAEPGTSVTITAALASGGAYYKFWVNSEPYCGTAAPFWQVIKDWSTDKTAVWTPAEAGVHTLVVWVADAPTNDCAMEMLGETYEVGAGENCYHSLDVQMTPSAGASNVPVTISAQAEGTDIQHKFFLNTADFCADPSGYEHGWQVLKDWSDTNHVTFNPPAPGIYTIVVHSRRTSADTCVAMGGMVYRVTQ